MPACSARRNLHDHHLLFRSRGGGNARDNRITVCAWHHLRGIHQGRRVLFVNPDDLADRGLGDGDLVDIVSEYEDGVERRAPAFRVVPYPTPRDCCAAYFPETNVLVPLDSTAAISNTPTSKSIVVRLEPVSAQGVLRRDS